jgi:secretion/DNA translocation related TadE-like protein
MKDLKNENGAVSVLVVAMVFMLLTLVSAIMMYGSVLQVHRLAGAVADQAALAAANQYLDEPQMCPKAAAIAYLNQARLTGCEIWPDGVQVEISITLSPIQQQWLNFVGNPSESIRISSRAGWSS